MELAHADLPSELALHDLQQLTKGASPGGERDGVVMLDVHGDNWQIVDASPAFEKSCGLKLSEVCGRNFWDVFQLPKHTKIDAAAILECDGTFEDSFTCKPSGRSLRLCVLPAVTNQLASHRVVGTASLVPSEKEAGVSNLGLDVNKAVDITGRDTDEAPEGQSLCYADLYQSLHTTADDLPEMTRTCLEALCPNSTGGGGTFAISSCSAASCQYTAPAHLGQLDFGRLLGSGSFGKVYCGVQNGHLAVAIKVLDCCGQGTGSMSKQLEEVKIASMLDHPLIVKILAHGTSMELVDHRPIKVAWIVEELCDLGTLTSAAERGWLRVGRAIEASPCVPTLVATLRDIAEAMSYVHSRSVIHADLTGRNILLASDSSVRGFMAKLCNFGISRLVADSESIETESLGAITHMPPEMMERQLLLPATDVWAFGVLAWEAYHGKCAYKGRSSSQIVLDVVLGKALPWPEDIPEALLALLKRCLSAGHDERPQFCSIAQELGAHG